MSVKDKPLKKCHSDSRITIDVVHKDIIDGFSKKRINQSDIEEDINEYYLDNGLILNEYYNNKNETKIKDIQINDNILNFFKLDVTKETDNCTDNGTDNGIDNCTDNCTDNGTDNGTDNPDNIIKYLSNINDTYLNENIRDIDETINICNNCGNTHLKYMYLESNVFCNKCGYTEKVLFENDKTSYKETPKEISYFAYKRINHFNEWITKFQGKETTDIPSHIYTDVIRELNKNIHLDIKKITNQQVRDILKKLKYNKYYENITNIINVISGRSSPIITRECEGQLRSMFKEIQKPFMKNCPDNRTNFLSYSYVLHKFCELLELDYLLEYFPYLKSREKLQQQDFIWKKICNDLEWQYIPSI